MFNNNILASPSKDSKLLHFKIKNLALNIETSNQMSPDRQRDSLSALKHGDKTPLLFVDVNLGGDNSERIIVFEGDTAVDLSHRFCEEHGLDEDTREKLEELL